MGKFKIQKDGKTLWIKEVDNSTGTLTFTENEDEAYDKEGGDYFVKAEADFIRFHYKNDYPEVETLVGELWHGFTYAPNEGATYAPNN